MARLWQSGFGLQSTSGSVEFTSISAGVTIQNTVTRIGPWALRTNPTATTQFVRQHGFASDQSIAGYQRFYLRIASAPTGNTTICRFVNTANDPAAQLRLTTSRTLVLLDAAGNTVGSASSALTVDTWYRVELYIDASSNPGTVTARLDGTQFASGANSAQTAWARWLIGPVVSTTTDLYYADWAVNDTSGSAQTSWPGEGVVLTLMPNAAGDANAWNNTSNAAGSTNNYQLVDETPPNDSTDYVQSGTLNNEDMYNVTDSGIAASDIINCVMVGVRYRNSTADAVVAAKLQIRKAAAGTTTQSTDLIPNATSFRTNANAEPRNYPIILYLDPDGSAWTQSTVDSMQIGVKLTTAGTHRIQVTSVWAVVDYSVATNASAEAASATGTANNAAAKVSPAAGAASGTGTAYDATVTTQAGGTNASAEAAAATATAHNAAPSVGAAASAATAAGTANNPSTAVTSNAAAATATATANNPATAISVPAGVATATGTGNDATIALSRVAPAEAAAGTATANNATPRVEPTPITATASGTAHNPSAAVNVTAAAATGTAAANNATVALSFIGPAEAAAATASALNATVIIAPTATPATATAAANNATGANDGADAEAAAGTGTANSPAPSVAPAAGSAAATATANPAAPHLGPAAQAAAATGAAFNPSVKVTANASAATATATANDATALTGAIGNAATAGATGTAHDATASIQATAAPATAAGTANGAAPAIAPTPSAASAAGAANNAGPGVAPGTGNASASGAAHDATARVGASAQTATAAGTANNATVLTGTFAQAGAASASASALDATITAENGPVPTGSWYGLLAILHEAADLARGAHARAPQACPNDGEPMRVGPDGKLFCSFDGWRPDGSYVGAAQEYAVARRDASIDLSLTIEDDPWF